MKSSSKYRFLFFIFIAFAACTNPFAPRLADVQEDDAVLGNQTTVEGVFKNFRYAYIFKDTVVYSQLLADDFTFTYRNYEKGIDVTMSREEDLLSTARMFSATQNLDLVWNEINLSYGDSLVKDISRSFQLTIVFSSTDIVNIYGRAFFRLKRPSSDDIWKINHWRDESNY